MFRPATHDRSDLEPTVGTKDEIEVTAQMIEAGLEEMGEHHFGDDLAIVLEHVFRAMAYASLDASSTSASK